MKRLQETDPILPLLDLMAANHAARLGMKIPPALKREMERRHATLARRHPNPSRVPDDVRRRLMAGMPKPTDEVVARHQAEWQARAEDVIARYG